MPQPLDSGGPAAVRSRCARALDALRAGREEIDALNVFPVADADTGTNLYRTLEAGVRALDEARPATAAAALRTVARGALLGACGNSGTILAQLLHGFAETVTAGTGDGTGTTGASAGLLVRALRRAADSARAAVARPVDGTMLTVAAAAADAAARAGGEEPAAVVRAAYEGAREALRKTPEQLGVLRRAGVVDAGGEGLVRILEALAGEHRAAGTGALRPAGPADEVPAGPAYEVMYLLDAGGEEVRGLRARLDAFGDSLVIGGGDGLWSVHVHTDDAGAAVEAGIAAGRPHRIRITHLGPAPAPCVPPAEPSVPSRGRAVVAVVHGDGLAQLCARAGALVVRAGADGTVTRSALTEAAASARVHGADEAVLLPNDTGLHAVAAHAADEARARGVRTAVIPTRAVVQGLAALAVHEAGRRFDEDVVTMTSAAGATRYGEVTVAGARSWTTAGVCEAGDVLGMIDGDVAVIGSAVADVAAEVLERMLASGGELVTLVTGEGVPAGLGDRLAGQVRRGHLAVDTVVYDGGRQAGPLLIGVE